MEDYKKIIGSNIKQALDRKGITQADFARRLDIYPSQLSGYVKGKSLPNPELFNTMASELNLTVRELLIGRDVAIHKDVKYNDVIYKEDSFSLEGELKAECQSVINYAKTLKQSTSSGKIQSLANLIENKVNFVRENL